MSEYINTKTGEVKSQGQWRNHFKNVSLPKVWTKYTLEGLGLEPVLYAPKPTPDQYQTVVRNGVEKDSNDNWVTAWAVRDMFADYTNDDGVIVTKAEQEAAYQATLDAKIAESNRTKRNALLSETDYLALSDNTLTTTMADYRQALRDITGHTNWPNLEEKDWPVKP